MPWWEHALKIFDNESVAAFLGAAFGAMFTYLTVAHTDKRRDRKTVKHIHGEIERALTMSPYQLEAVEQMHGLMREHGQVKPGKVLGFELELIRDLKARVLHQLDSKQRLALDGVLHRMDGVNKLLAEVDTLQQDLLAGSLPSVAVPTLERRLVDAVVNLKVFQEQADKYLKGDYSGVTTIRFKPEDYGPRPSPSPPQPPPPASGKETS